jgi:hypothetical protein
MFFFFFNLFNTCHLLLCLSIFKFALAFGGLNSIGYYILVRL